MYGPLRSGPPPRHTRQDAASAGPDVDLLLHVVYLPGANTTTPILALYTAMSDEARVDLLAYARCRLRRDGG